MKKLLPIIFCLITQFVFAQNVTVTDIESVKERLIKNKIQLTQNGTPENGLIYVPIKFHLVGNDSGNDHILEPNVFKTLCALNEAFLPMEIQFYLFEGFNYINSNNSNTNPLSFNADLKFSENRVYNVINVFIVKTITTSGGGNNLGTYDSSPEKDWIIIQRDQFGQNIKVLGKELGHYFGLLSTYHCMENYNGQPTVDCGGAIVPVEYQDGTNCETAADMICDTPPDYIFGFGWPDCNYTGLITDPSGASINPHEENFMSSFLCENNNFTPTQIGLIQTDLQNRINTNVTWQKLDVDTNYVAPDPLGAMTVTTPINNSYEAVYNQIEFKWNTVPDADAYLYIIDRLNVFVFNPIANITTDTSIIITELESNRTYHWKVVPFHKGDYCAPCSEIQSFITGTDIVSTNNLQNKLDFNFSISPNPIFNKHLQINIASFNSSTIDFYIFNPTGSVVYLSENQTILAGGSKINIDLNNFSSGIYFLKIKNEDKWVVQRFVIH